MITASLLLVMFVAAVCLVLWVSLVGSVLSLAWTLLLGAACGYIAGRIMNAADKSFWMNVLLGISGSVVGGLIGRLLHLGGGWFISAILSIAGACLVIWVCRKLAK